MLRNVQSNSICKYAILIIIPVLLLVALIIYGSITTPERYLYLADRRTLLGIPNAIDVLSNIPFLIVGFWALLHLNKVLFQNNKEKIFYQVFFFAVILVTFGSAYYHWSPSPYTLMWDRFPIAIAMSAFLCAMIAERINVSFARVIFWPLVMLSLLSVYYWYYTITQGQEDVRLYAFFLGFLPVIILPFILLMFKSPYIQSKYLWLALIAFVLARICEGFDEAIYGFFGQVLGGHALKHLLMALACYFVWCYLICRHREPEC